MDKVITKSLIERMRDHLACYWKEGDVAPQLTSIELMLIEEAANELAALKEQLRLCNVDQFSTAAELAAAQAEIERLKKRKDECCNGWGAALKDAVENMEIAQGFKKLMDQYRQREAEANKALRVAAGLLSTMLSFSGMHPDDVLEGILKETRDMK